MNKVEKEEEDKLEKNLIKKMEKEKRELQAKHDAEDKARSQSNGGDKQADLVLTVK